VTATATPQAGPGLVLRSRRGRQVLLATVLGSGIAQLDGTIVNVALPRIGSDLHAGLTALQWTVNGYTLALAGLLLLGGSLGDRLGRRRIFVIGVAWFAVASAGCAAAPSPGVLVALRVVQGVGGALLTPGSLAILESVFREDERAAAVGAWSGLGGVATAFGPVLGGALVGMAPWGWRLALLINVPLAAVVLAVARAIPETRDPGAAGPLDVPGAAVAAAGLSALIFGLTIGPGHGWPPAAVVGVVAGLALLAAFVVLEDRRPAPLLPPSLFRIRQFSAANAVTFVVYAALGGTLFLLPVQLQVGSGFSPTESGAAFLPFTVVMLLLAARGGRLAQRIGPRLPMTVGPIVAGLGELLFLRVGQGASYVTDVLPAVVVMGLGMAATVAPLTATVLGAAPPGNAGIASAVNNTVARAGSLVAVAVLPGIAGITQASYRNPAALSSGFHTAVLVTGVLTVAGGLLSAVTIQNTPVRSRGVSTCPLPPATR
jgi:EmrB/QacA subfamily drug resistance transporter